jgi:beta-glucuronidase
MAYLQRAGVLVCALLFFLAGNAAPAQAYDLVPNARLRVSSVADMSGMPLDQTSGLAALRDGDEDTAWKPVDGATAWIEIGLSSTGEPVGVTLDRIELVWGEGYPEALTVTAGPDRETQRMVTRVAIAQPDSLDVIPPIQVDNVQVVFLKFEGKGFSVAEVRVHASQAPQVAALTGLSVSERDGQVWLSYDWPAGAHHIEIERSGDPSLDHTWTTVNTRSADRPPDAGAYWYNARAVDYTGTPGEWSPSVILNNYAPSGPTIISWRGVVEGFYGPPWSWSTRLDTVRQLGLWGFNTYIYAPKKDSKHRTQWRDLYDEDELANFKALLELGHQMGVRIVYAISPGQSIDPLSNSDLNDLTAKLDQLAQIGYVDFALLMDDIDIDPDADSGANHAVLVDRLYTWLEETLPDEPQLWFVPTVYAGTAGRISGDERAYLEAFKSVPQNVLIGWTGEEIFDETITRDEAESIAELVGHKLWLWDNYPVNDGSLGLGMHMGPVSGRGVDLLTSENLAGVMVNPMIEGRASWFVLSSWADLLIDPTAYDPDTQTVERVAEALDPDLDASTFLLLRDYFLSFKDWDGMENTPVLNDAVETFITRLSLGSPAQIRAAADELHDLLLDSAEMAARIEWDCTKRGLSDELSQRLSKLLALLEGAQIAIDLLQADLYGWRQTFTSYDRRLTELVEGPLALNYPIAENNLLSLIELARAPENERPIGRLVGQALVEPIIAEPLPQARVGQPWYYDAGFNILPDRVTWGVETDVSLNAAIAENGRLSLVPAQAGRYWVRVEAQRDETVISKLFPLVVVPALAQLDAPSLPMTTELLDQNGVPVLMQNGIVVPDVAMCQYARMSLSGSWKKRRMTVDHNLTFSERSSDVLDLMEMESGGAHLPEFDDTQWTDTTLPAVENRMPPTGHPSGPEELWGGVWYRREAPVPSGGKQVRLVMLAADYLVDVWADGLYLGWHEGGYSPAYFSLPPELSDRETVTLTVRIDRPRPGDVSGLLPPKPESDWWLYAGIVQDMYWEYLPATQKVVIARAAAIPQSSTGQMQLDLVLEELSGAARDIRVRVEAFQTDPTNSAYWSGASISSAMTNKVEVADNETTLTLNAGERRGLRMSPRVISASLWEPKNPRIYAIRIQVVEDAGENTDTDEAVLDRYISHMGFREIRINEEGKILFNGQRTFWPGIARHEDSADAGRTMTWTRILNDLRMMKAQGAWLLRAGHYPNHPDTTVLADRLGLVVMTEIPAWWMDEQNFAEQKQRGLAIQMWREMIFQNISRPSVVMWGACNECRPAPDAQPMRDYLSELHADLDTNYPDGRLVTQSLAANWYDMGGSETVDAVDVAGFTSYFGIFYGNSETIEVDTAAFFERVHEDFPLMPLFITEYGALSEPDQSDALLQLQVLNDVWKAVQPYASVTEKRKVNPDGYVLGMTWWTMFDWYTIGIGLQTMGLYSMDRSVWKPAAERLRELYMPYTSGPIDDGEPDTPLNKEDVTDCSHAGNPGSIFILMMLLGLGAFLRGRKIRRRA